jgi:prepilin-type N-terminal cleavage/methylation domain-containing protein
MKTARSQQGGTLIEMVVAIVIVSIALTGILSTINVVNRRSVDPVIQLQGIIFAENMLEEMASQPFDRLASHTWEEVKGLYSDSPFIEVLESRGFEVSVAVSQASLFTNVPDGFAKRILVTCQHPGFTDAPIELATYRYAALLPSGGLSGFNEVAIHVN